MSLGTENFFIAKDGLSCTSRQAAFGRCRRRKRGPEKAPGFHAKKQWLAYPVVAVAWANHKPCHSPRMIDLIEIKSNNQIHGGRQSGRADDERVIRGQTMQLLAYRTRRGSRGLPLNCFPFELSVTLRQAACTSEPAAAIMVGHSAPTMIAATMKRKIAK